jgi:hypothetical protein
MPQVIKTMARDGEGNRIYRVFMDDGSVSTFNNLASANYHAYGSATAPVSNQPNTTTPQPTDNIEDDEPAPTNDPIEDTIDDPYSAYQVSRDGTKYALSDEEIKFIDLSKALGYNDEEINTFLDKRFAHRTPSTVSDPIDMSNVEFANETSTEEPETTTRTTTQPTNRGARRFQMHLDRGVIDIYTAQDALMANSTLRENPKYRGLTSQQAQNAIDLYYKNNLSEENFNFYKQGGFDPLLDTRSDIYNPQRVADVYGENILQANDPEGYDAIFNPDPDPVDDTDVTDPIDDTGTTDPIVTDPVVTPTPVVDSPVIVDGTGQPVNIPFQPTSGTYQAPVVQPQFVQPVGDNVGQVDPVTGTYTVTPTFGTTVSQYQPAGAQISTGVVGQSLQANQAYNPTIGLNYRPASAFTPITYNQPQQTGYMPRFTYQQGGAVPNMQQQNMPMTQQNMFGGFKPQAMQRIAGSLGYQGDMNGFNNYLNNNPDKKQMMDMYTQKAMQMANGGMAKKNVIYAQSGTVGTNTTTTEEMEEQSAVDEAFSESLGGTGANTIQLGSSLYQQEPPAGDTETGQTDPDVYTPSDPRVLGQQFIPQQDFVSEGTASQLQDVLATQAIAPGMPVGATFVPVGVAQEAGQFVDPTSGQVVGASALGTTLASTTQAAQPAATAATLMAPATSARSVKAVLEGGEVVDAQGLLSAVTASTEFEEGQTPTYDAERNRYIQGGREFTPEQFAERFNLDPSNYITGEAGIEAQTGFISDAAQSEAAQTTTTGIATRMAEEDGLAAATIDTDFDQVVKLSDLTEETERSLINDIETGQSELVSGLGTVDATKVAKYTNAVAAAQASENSKRTVRGQLETLMQDFEGGETPPWAAGAMRLATQQMAARGLGTSSIAGQAIVQAAMEAALPIAQADAATQAAFDAQNLSNKQQMAMLSAEQRAKFMGLEFDQGFQAKVINASKISDIANVNFTASQQIALENSRLANSESLAELNNSQALVMAEAAALSQLDVANLSNRQQTVVQNAQNFLQMDMANLSNRQQMELFKGQQRTQSLFSDQAAQNAAAQFNASSQNQVDQFFASLANSTAQFNATQSNAQSQFNAGQVNVIERFNTEVNNQREQFNATNRLVIDQANAQWRREIATSDTAAVNRANEINSEALLDMSRDAYNDLWQFYSDNMEQAWTAAESEKDRMTRLAIQNIASNTQYDLAEMKQDYSTSVGFGSLIGKILTSDLTGTLGGSILGPVFDIFSTDAPE